MAKQLDFFDAEKSVEALSSYRVEDLKNMYQALAGANAPVGNKLQLVTTLARLLTWDSDRSFDAFFSTLPPLLQEAIRIGSFRQFVEVRQLERQFKVTIISKKELYGYYEQFELNRDLRLGVFFVEATTTLRLAPPIARMFAAHLPKPDGYDYAPLATSPRTAWSSESSIHETIPLATAWLDRTRHEFDRYDLMRKGMLKSAITACRAASGFGSFPLASAYKLDALELYARFLACFGNKASDKSLDSYALVKILVDRLFDYDPERVAEPYQGTSFEILCLQDHLQRKPGTTLDWWDAPVSRHLFRNVLNSAASDGGWFDADAVVTSMMLHGHRFGYLSETDTEYMMRLKADELIFDGAHYVLDKYEKYFSVMPGLHFRLIATPLFKAYCYLMATLGILEIYEEEPESALVHSKKRGPLSPYEALRAFRVTGFGRWCLGIDTNKPKPPTIEYEAIADDELPLVTFKGTSLECRLFLDTIGVKLGTERYRITETSFVAGCSSAAEIEKRIHEFKRLISKKPAQHWQRLFSRALSKASSFSSPETAYVFRLPTDPEIRTLFISARSMDALYIRAEGGLIIVPQSAYRKFKKAAEAIGFIIPL